MKPIAVMIAALSLVTTSWAQSDHTNNGRRSKPMKTVNDSRMVAPALEKYAQGPVEELWKRPGLTPRDRSIVTIAALIARNQTIEMPYYFNLALDNGVKPREISEIITHLVFTPAGQMRWRQSPPRKRSSPNARLGPISFLPLRLRFFRSITTRKRNVQRLWISSSATSLLASCSTLLTFCSAICGCARTLRLEIGAWSPSAP